MTENRELVYTLWYCDHGHADRNCLILRPGEQPPPGHEDVARVLANFRAASLCDAAHEAGAWLNPWSSSSRA